MNQSYVLSGESNRGLTDNVPMLACEVIINTQQHVSGHVVYCPMASWPLHPGHASHSACFFVSEVCPAAHCPPHVIAAGKTCTVEFVSPNVLPWVPALRHSIDSIILTASTLGMLMAGQNISM